MDDMKALLNGWGVDIAAVRKQMYRAPTARERERWHAIWLRARGWPAAQVAEALERDAHTVGIWIENFRKHGPAGLTFEQTGGPPPSSPRKSRTS